MVCLVICKLVWEALLLSLLYMGGNGDLEGRMDLSKTRHVVVVVEGGDEI